jgi:hypothetical protein
MRHSLLKSLAAAAFIASLSAGVPAHAADSDASAPAAPAPAAQAQAKPVPHEMSIEARISSLHDKLQITAEQEETWKAVAETMRANEQTIHALIKERHAKAKTLDAIEDLESYEKIADAHAEGLKKLIPVFKNLYEEMSADQKKNADTVFGRYEGHPDRKAGAAK